MQVISILSQSTRFLSSLPFSIFAALDRIFFIFPPSRSPLSQFLCNCLDPGNPIVKALNFLFPRGRQYFQGSNQTLLDMLRHFSRLSEFLCNSGPWQIQGRQYWVSSVTMFHFPPAPNFQLLVF